MHRKLNGVWDRFLGPETDERDVESWDLDFLYVSVMCICIFCGCKSVL